MMKTLTRKVLPLLLALMLVLPMAMSAASAEDRPVVTILTNLNTLVTDYQDNYFTKWVEDEMNVDLEFIFLPADTKAAAEKFNMMVIGQEYLGDIIYWKLGATSLPSYDESGAIAPIDEYIAKYDTNMEAYSQKMYGDDTWLKMLTMANGHIYTTGRTEDASYNATKYRGWINQAWLDKLNLEMPTTPEELYYVLKAFKEQDPNGNGVADEIPMLGCVKWWSANPLYYLITPFVQWHDVGGNLLVNDGKVYAAYATDEYRDAMKFVNRLVKEGLLDDRTWSLSTAQYKAYGAEENPIVGVHFYTYAAGAMPATHANIGDYVNLPYMANYKTGERVTSYTPFDPQDNQNLFLSKTAKDPDLAFRVIDFLFSEEANTRFRFGIEDVHYTVLSEEEAAIAREKMGVSADMKLIVEGATGWGEACNMSWQGQGLGTFDENIAVSAWNGDENGYLWRRYLAVQDQMSIAPALGTYYPSIAVSDDENRLINENGLSEINSYRGEVLNDFCLGRQDPNDDEVWNEYIDLLYLMGLEEMLDAYQVVYDRYTGAKSAEELADFWDEMHDYWGIE